MKGGWTVEKVKVKVNGIPKGHPALKFMVLSYEMEPAYLRPWLQGMVREADAKILGERQ